IAAVGSPFQRRCRLVVFDGIAGIEVEGERGAFVEIRRVLGQQLDAAREIVIGKATAGALGPTHFQREPDANVGIQFAVLPLDHRDPAPVGAVNLSVRQNRWRLEGGPDRLEIVAVRVGMGPVDPAALGGVLGAPAARTHLFGQIAPNNRHVITPEWSLPSLRGAQRTPGGDWYSVPYYLSHYRSICGHKNRPDCAPRPFTQTAPAEPGTRTPSGCRPLRTRSAFPRRKRPRLRSTG